MKYTLKYFFLLCPFLMLHANEPTGQSVIRNEVSETENFVTEYITPTRIIWMSDTTNISIKNAQSLLKPFNGQVAVNDASYCSIFAKKDGNPSILLDFGEELQGGIEISACIREEKKPVKVRVCLGESVSEAMSSIDSQDKKSTATNDHSMREYIVEVPWLGTVEVGKSGFRFVRIDVLSENVKFNLKAVRAISVSRDIPFLGSFKCSDNRLNKIWKIGAKTVYLNMQNFIWDGIKRDRLVWIGDMHPEVMTINNVFGGNVLVHKTLDFAKKNTPLPGWMNGMCSYSLWWIIVQHDLYLYQGDKEYLRLQKDYIRPLLSQVCNQIRDGQENLSGTRFLDWPTSEMPDIIHSGLQSLTYLAICDGKKIAGWLDDKDMEQECTAAIDNLMKHQPKTYSNKQAAALKILSGYSTNIKSDSKVILKDGACDFSTFFGYYMLEALAKADKYEEAMKIISDYWGAMVDLGATTFWEDLDYSKVKQAGRIDELLPAGKFDIHADGGAYCYKGLRCSLCHGWASGPTSWLSRYVLGVIPLEPGCKTLLIEPHLGHLEFANGTFPTPYGVVKISHTKKADGSIVSDIKAPDEIKVILNNKN